MKQLVVEGIPGLGEQFSLDRAQSHYLARVRRVHAGDEVLCTDGNGGRVAATVVSTVNPEAVTLRVVSDARTAPGAPDAGSDGPPVTMYLSLLKGKKFDTVVRQVTELGVDRIVPVVTHHCVSRPDPRDLNRKRERWQEIVRGATQQSGRSRLPEVGEPRSLSDIVPVSPDILAVAFHESAHETFGGADVSVSDGDAPRAVWALIGPEGGLAPGEIESLDGSGWRIRRMPVPVLRAETAAIAAATLVQSLRSAYTAHSAKAR